MPRRLLSFVASLQLTLICLGAAIALIFAGTIAQVHLGVHEAQQRYFQSLLVWWPPDGGGFRIPIFPGGHLIGAVLLVNLIAAHAGAFVDLAKARHPTYARRTHHHAGGRAFYRSLRGRKSYASSPGETPSNYSEDFA